MNRISFEKAPDIQRKINQIIGRLGIGYLDKRQIVCVRSRRSKSRARARIWAFPRVWQTALGLSPHYVIEFLSEKFDRLSDGDRIKTMIHELLHIPKTFSGALKPHRTKYFRLEREVSRLYRQYCRSEKNEVGETSHHR